MRIARWTNCALALALVAGLSNPLPVAAQEATGADEIRELLELTGAGDLAAQIMQGMMGPMRQAMPQVPAEWWEQLMAKVDAESLEALVVPIYERHFTDQEIAAMLAFYRTAEGRSIVAKMPVVMQESMRVGQAWGQNLAEEIVRELRAAGYEPPTGP